MDFYEFIDFNPRFRHFEVIIILDCSIFYRISNELLEWSRVRQDFEGTNRESGNINNEANVEKWCLASAGLIRLYINS